MKNIYYGIVFAFAIIVLAFGSVYLQLTQAKAGDADLSKKNTSTVQIELKNPISPDALFAAGKNTSFNEMIIESDFTVNNEVIHDFYIVDTKNKNKNIKEDYIKNRKAFLADTKNVAQLSSADSKNVEDILVTKITVTGEKGDVNKMKKGFEISKINIKPDQPVIDTRVFNKPIPKEAHLIDNKMFDNKTFSVTAESASLNSLVPNSGTSYFNLSSSGGRYVQQFMKWDSVNFSTEQTYEHDVWLYNYDRKTYLNGGTTSFPGCWPELTYAATSWPAASKPYIDTRFGYNSDNVPICEIDELAYTIGAAQASALQANINYYTYMRTENGNDSLDKFKLQAQIGHRSESLCYLGYAWCSFGDQSFNLIPAWSTAVPGTQTWTYNKVPNAPSDTLVNNPTATSLRVNFTDNATDETNILIERKGGTSGYWVTLGGFGVLSGTNNWYWTNTGLLSGYWYCYRLRAVNAFGSSAYSNEACGLTS